MATVKGNMDMSGKPAQASPWRTHGKANKPAMPVRLRLLRLVFSSVGVVLPRVLGRLAFRLWFRTYRVQAPAREARLLAEAGDQSFQRDDKRIACWSWGSGPRVLLLHGWNGRGAQLGSFVKPLVEAGYRVMTLDLPGHGQTAGRRTDIFEIRDVLCDLNELHGPFAGVIAHSFGVPCLAVAVKAGFQTEAIVSLSAPAGFDNLLKSFGRYLRLPPGVLADVERRLHAYIGTRLWAEFAEHYATHGEQRSLLIHDSDDCIVPLGEAKTLLQHWPNARLMVTSGLGHRRILKNKAVIRASVAFIQGDKALTGEQDSFLPAANKA
jgi:pimeloyl-ACP methyl ester carboxylesterase